MTKLKKMNASGIDYLDYAWNPVTGCLHGCEYCWARKMAKRFYVKSYTTRYEKREHVDFKPTFHLDRLDWPKNTKKPGRVGVVFMGDLFGDWVPDEWIEQVFKACEAAPWHTLFFLSKAGDYFGRALAQSKPMGGSPQPNQWFGASVTGNDGIITVGGKKRDAAKWRVSDLSFMNSAKANTYLSVEPFLAPLIVDLSDLKWLIVGAQTQPLKLPRAAWVLDIRKQCKDLGIPLFEKKNLAKLDLPGGLIQEYPEGMNDNSRMDDQRQKIQAVLT
jgi:protein gp37